MDDNKTNPMQGVQAGGPTGPQVPQPPATNLPTTNPPGGGDPYGPPIAPPADSSNGDSASQPAGTVSSGPPTFLTPQTAPDIQGVGGGAAPNQWIEPGGQPGPAINSRDGAAVAATGPLPGQPPAWAGSNAGANTALADSMVVPSGPTSMMPLAPPSTAGGGALPQVDPPVNQNLAAGGDAAGLAAGIVTSGPPTFLTPQTAPDIQGVGGGAAPNQWIEPGGQPGPAINSRDGAAPANGLAIDPGANSNNSSYGSDNSMLGSGAFSADPNRGI